MDNHIEQFIEAIRASGLTPPSVIEDDGKLRRFASNGKPNDDAGWYILHGDGMPAGTFGCHRTGLSQNWKANINRAFTLSEKKEHLVKFEAMRLEQEAEKTLRHAETRTRAKEILDAAQPDPNDHPYLKKKGIKPHGVRVDKDSRLVIPMSSKGELHSLQFIGVDGSKKFLYGGRVASSNFSIGKLGDVICIVEGFATGASIHEATGYLTVIAFSAGNLKNVAEATRAKFKDTKIVIAADDDHLKEGNPGLTAAQDAARSVGGLVAIPDFGDNRPDEASDFNDLLALCGPDAVVHAIEKATTPDSEKQESNITVEKNGVTPEPLPSLPSVDKFNYLFLPNSLRGYVKDIADRMQCPEDFAAVGALVMIGAIVGRKVGIRPMRQNDWTVIPNLWGAVIGNSGIMKSPTLSEVLSPIKKLQANAFEEFNTAKAEYEINAELVKIQKSVDKSNVRKELKRENSAKALEILKLDDQGDPPILNRYITNNASYEALGELLIQNPNGLLVEADELIGLLKQLDSSGQEVARSFYLTAADGDKPYTFDRIMRGKGLHVPALCLSIIGGIQPGILAEYVRLAIGGGAGADGLLQRFGLMVYPDINPEWKEVDRYPDKIARDSVRKLVEKLDNLKPVEIGTEDDTYGGIPFLRFDDAAQDVFSEWRGDLEHRLRSGEEHPAFVSHLSKYRKLIPSLALINHLCDVGHGAVSSDALLRAVAFSDYLESHAHRIYSYATRPDIDAAKTLLKRLANGKLNPPFKARDIYQKGWAGLETPNKAQSAINLLVEYRHLREEEKDTGGRPTTHYHWNKS